MSKFKIEIQISILTIIIGIVVVTIGYFSYKSLSQIVYSIQQGTRPDNKLSIIKEIAFDLTSVENAVRIYSLTNNNDDLEVFYALEDDISENFEMLHNLKEVNKFELALIDSLSKLSQEKLDLWNQILVINLSAKSMFPAFSKLYSNLDEPKMDTIPTIAGNEAFSQKNTNSRNAGMDTSFADPSVERKEIKKNIQRLELEIYRNNKRKNVKESQLIEKNVVVSAKITQLISEAEKGEATRILEKADEADRLAKATYKRLGIYTISAVLLLFIALFVLFNYLRKARAAQRALADARKKAEALAKAKEQFAANVSHELRTPVNAIFGLSEQVLQKKLDKDTSEMVSVIFNSAGHLRNIVNDTLDFSKILSKNIILESVYFSPEKILEEVYSLFKHETANKGITLNYAWHGDKPDILIGDPLRLKQIIINLAGNAIKFTENGKVEMMVNGKKKGNNNFELEIKVIDTGIGIEENKLGMVFDEYVQIENQTGKKYSGTGLGLSIVKKLVDLQGGKIEIESLPGIGTKVTVNIVYREGKPEEAEKPINFIPEIPESFRQLSVLIADDEDYNRFLLRSILQKWGVKFKEVKNGNEAEKVACNEHFDIILMDINMPEKNGIEAAKSIVLCDPETKIIAVTAANDELDREACFNAGMKGFVFKPYAEEDLFEMMDVLIKKELKNNLSVNGKQKIDISVLRHLSGNDDKFLDEMIHLFIKSAETGVSGIEKAIKVENWNEVFENAHKMAAPVKHIGAMQLYEKIKTLEKMAKGSAKVESVVPVFQEIKIEIKELNIILKSVLTELKV